MRQIKKPELVAPAGDWMSLQSAVSAGCDAVYFGVKGFNMRYTAHNFDLLEIKKVMAFLKKNGKKGYLALNTTVYDKEIEKINKILKEAKKSKVDAVILWDMAVLSAAKKLGLNIHLSTQASVSNFSAFKFYSSLGVKRIVLARECPLKEIKQIIQQAKKSKIKCTVETFVHGAMCVSISGRCFLSQHTFNESANRGKCLQPCRREYFIKDKEGECEYVLGEDYLLSAKDLATITFLDQLIKSGISAFKIEGRVRSPEYVGITTSAYRTAIDAFAKGKLDKKLKEKLLKKVSSVYNRTFSSGFYYGREEDLGAVRESKYEKIYLGDVKKFFKKISVAEILVRNKELKRGEEILITGKTTPASFVKVDEIELDHKRVSTVRRGEAAGVKLPFAVRPNDKVFIWRRRA